MQAVILAAGQSSRFYPFNAFGHKSMVPLLGKPLLQHTLESLKKSAITNVIIVVSKNSPIPITLPDIPGLTVTYVVQNEPLGMGHALLQTKKYLEETFFLLSGYHFDVDNFTQDMRNAQKNSQQVVLLAKDDEYLEKYGILQVDGNRVLSIIEKPKEGKNGLRTIGIYLLNKSFLQTLSEIELHHYHFEKAIDTYAKLGNVVYVNTKKPVITLKYSWDLLKIKNYLLSKMKSYTSKTAHISKSAVLEGEIYLSENVQIFEGACIKGPCFLGENVVIGNNAIVRGGVIAEKNAVIGATMEVKNSILMQDVTTHTGYIGDSVIGTSTRLAAGFCSANVRFDRGEIIAKVREVIVNTHKTHMGVVMGQYVDIGVNVSTMPGIILGNHITVGPGTYLMENVEDNSLTYTKFQTVMKKKK